MGAYAMGAPWLRFGFDCGNGEAEQRLREVWAQMVGKARQRPTPQWAGMGHGFGGPGFGGPGFGGPPWARGMRGPKARRGDVRAAILSVLSDQPRNGYQVIQEIAERTAGAWKPSPGSIYPTLQQLEDEGLVVQVEDGGRKVYTLTDAGRDYVATASGRDGGSLGSDVGDRERRRPATDARPGGGGDVAGDGGRQP